MAKTAKTPEKKNNKSKIVKIWNGYEFRLRVPATINKDNKIEVLFNFIDPETKKGKQIKKSNGIDRYANEKTYTAQANELVEALIENLADGWNPINNTVPEKVDRLDEKSTIGTCLNFIRKERQADYDAGKIQAGELQASNRVYDLFEAYVKKFNLDSEKPTYFTVNDINKFMRYCEADVSKLIPKYAKDESGDMKVVVSPLSKTSYNSYLHRLTFFFEYLITERLLVYNPTKGAHKYQTANLKTRYTIFENDELELVRECLAKEDRYRDMMIGTHLLYTYRIRAKEQFRIKVGWFDFQNNLLIFPETVVERGRTIKSTKNGNAAAFSISEKVMNIVKQYLGDNINNPDYFLFGGRKQKHESYFSNKFKNMLKKHELPLHLKFYALKHTSNYNAYKTLGIEALSKINRHSSIQQTQDYIKSKLKKEIITVSPEIEF